MKFTVQGPLVVDKKVFIRNALEYFHNNRYRAYQVEDRIVYKDDKMSFLNTDKMERFTKGVMTFRDGTAFCTFEESNFSYLLPVITISGFSIYNKTLLPFFIILLFGAVELININYLRKKMQDLLEGFNKISPKPGDHDL